MTTSTNEKALSACDTEGLDNTTNDSYSPSGEPQSKEISALSVKLALHGFDFTATQCRDFLVHPPHGRYIYCKDLAAAQAFANKLGVSK